MQRTLLLIGLATALLGGCVLDTVADCGNLCDRYQECFDPDADLAECIARCEDRVDSGESDRADDCDACLDDQSTCLGAVGVCTVSCGPLLAP